MKKLFKYITLVLIASFLLTGCDYQQIPSGTVGKIKGPNGYEPEILPPSTVKINGLWTTERDKRYLFLVETTTRKYVQPIKVKLADKLDLKASIVFTGRIRGEDKVLNAIFNDIKMNDNIVTVDEVYDVYAKQIVLNTARGVISKYNVEEVHKNYNRITLELYKEIAPKLKGLPIQINNVTIGEIKYPEIVTHAIEAAKERRMQIEQEQAQVQIELTKKKGAEQLAEADYRIAMLKAKKERDYNRMIASGISADLLKLRELEIRELELQKWNGALPTTLLGAGTNDVPVILNPSVVGNTK